MKKLTRSNWICCAFKFRRFPARACSRTKTKSVEENFRRASNAAKLLQLSQAALDALSENENSLLTQAGAIGRTLQELQRVDSGAANLIELHAQAAGAWRELQSELSRYAEKVDIDPARLAELEERFNLIHSLKRKYGATLAEVIAFGDETKIKLQSLESRDAELARLNSELQKLDTEILAAGKKLSAARKKVIPQLAKAVGKQLEDLGFKQSKFDVEQKVEARSEKLESNFSNSQLPTPNFSGLDEIEFQFAPNPGEPAKPLRAIASSGEMARVMLALKTVLSRRRRNSLF
jgi:DNA repair protein RecN (Recombination protein N)